ncbi:MAG: L-arabinose ABC transporter ATP-binding protein AraG [Fimbriimonadaceae bacterium]|nr:L-arabinose ABC transporter ATP-binding protein AraG [Fimbriimonadaceae bacterium]
MSTTPYLQFQSISKGFPGVQALSDVTFGVREGSVHALCGENGAGKSTLLKILSGVYRADAGKMSFGDQDVAFHSPFEAIQSGVAVIYQELHLVPEMSVAENVYLGHPPHRGGWINRKQLLADTMERLKQVGVNISPNTRLGSLSIAQRQMVEIAKALSRDARIIAFDEPTSSLSMREVEQLFKIIDELKSQGRVILYVSHRMDEIFRVCDAATVLRDGCHVETFETLEHIDENVIVNRMVGRDIQDIFGYETREHGEMGLEANDITGVGLAGPASLHVRKGEIVGIFGLVGAGRSELLKAIYCASKGAGGSVKIQGSATKFRDPRGAIREGLMLCPEDRKAEGIVPIRSVQENINLSCRRRFSWLGFWIREKTERENAQAQVDRLRVRTPSLDQEIRLLSGGNQQKAILARWLSENVHVLMLDEPTRGIDVGAKREIYDILYTLAKQGVAVLFVSSELPEVLGISDRILVMRQGRIVGEVSRADATEETVLKLAMPVAEGVVA